MAQIPSTITFQSLAKSGVIPAPQRNAIQAAFNRLVADGGDGGAQSIRARAELHMTAALEGVRQTGEAGVFGSALGAAHALLPGGLDVKIPGTRFVAPLDGVGALLGLFAGAAAAAEPHGIGKTLANGGAACMTVFSFRKTHDLLADLRFKASGATAGGGASVGLNKIGKAQFAGEDEPEFGSEGGGAMRPGSRSQGKSFLSSVFGGESENRLVELARRL